MEKVPSIYCKQFVFLSRFCSDAKFSNVNSVPYSSYYQIWITILSETFIIWCPRSLECPSPCIVERQSHCFIQPNTQSNCLSLSAVIHDIFSLHTFQQGVNVVAIFKTKMAGVIFFSSEKQYMYIDETLEHGCTVFNCVSKCADKQKATK